MQGLEPDTAAPVHQQLVEWSRHACRPRAPTRSLRRMLTRGWLQGLELDRAALVHKLLRETPSAEAEWILYMDQQTLFDQPSFVFNFEFYAGRDLVVACDTWLMKSGQTGERVSWSWCGRSGGCILVRPCKSSQAGRPLEEQEQRPGGSSCVSST